MNPKDIKSLADVKNWLANHVAWSDKASEDCAASAIDVIDATERAAVRLTDLFSTYLK